MRTKPPDEIRDLMELLSYLTHTAEQLKRVNVSFLPKYLAERRCQPQWGNSTLQMFMQTKCGAVLGDVFPRRLDERKQIMQIRSLGVFVQYCIHRSGE